MTTRGQTVGFVWALAIITTAVFAGVALAGLKPPPPGLAPQPIAVTAQPIAHFDKRDPARTRFGRLTWRGGLVLSSPSPNFGGWSALAIDPDGTTLLAVSDAGTWMTATVDTNGRRVTGLSSAQIGAFASLAGKSLSRPADRDSESAALLQGTLEAGTLAIGFERNHRIGVFDVTNRVLSPPRRYWPLPPEARRMTANKGLEALAVIQTGPLKGALVAFSERLLDGKGRHTGWIWIDGKPQTLSLANPGDFDVTDAAGLPDGDLLVLERRFTWLEGVRMRLVRVPQQALASGAVLTGEVLLEADRSQEIDNMEGLAVHTNANGETVLTLISDDNFNAVLQRTVLLQFTLDGAGASGRMR